MDSFSISRFYNDLGEAFYRQGELSFATWFWRLAVWLFPKNHKAAANFRYRGRFNREDLKGKSREEILLLTPSFQNAQQIIMRGQTFSGPEAMVAEEIAVREAWCQIKRLEEL